ncbi:lipoate-protein ligase A [Xenococcus sp. PCC 7305]|uniref:lipoate--protein ligase family protein n=1 Tax=Xenococcus sp. PCC 7305 TaxID=102125 RepID=UPI0002AC4B35|nr:biotin/lipoate A/B protein ligase family protein [Xenococcus sp. PCC 7305]ELS03323.1 lipoate-protein ligase A [Xenococcus sp. PCC 7305]
MKDEEQVNCQLPKTWRLIPLLDASAQVQMAVDNWLIDQHSRGEQPPTLRFYTWSPAAISLGYHQKEYPEFWQDLIWQDQPLDIVRRHTGGRAVLHQGDLTYALVTSTQPGKRLAVYKNICQFLINGWRSLGVELSYGTANREYAAHHNCFTTATGADLLTKQGSKAIGSAQLRRGKALLQHGSMMLSVNSQLFVKIFNELPPVNLVELIADSKQQAVSNIVDTLVLAAQDWFNIDLVEQPLSDAEWQDVLSKSR